MEMSSANITLRKDGGSWENSLWAMTIMGRLSISSEKYKKMIPLKMVYIPITNE